MSADPQTSINLSQIQKDISVRFKFPEKAASLVREGYYSKGIQNGYGKCGMTLTEFNQVQEVKGYRAPEHVQDTGGTLTGNVDYSRGLLLFEKPTYLGRQYYAISIRDLVDLGFIIDDVEQSQSSTTSPSSDDISLLLI